MTYNLLHTDYSLPLLDRLLSVRGVFDATDDFLNPKLGTHRRDPLLLNDMDSWTDLIIQAMRSQKSICIFWDYDVDGVTSSFLLYTLLSHYFNYKNVKIIFPDRLKDWYGLKVHHVDTIRSAGHDMIITVDNGITSIQEVIHAKNIGLQVIITDHHKALDILPPADAIINPQVSPNYDFKWLCWAGVVLKLTSALLKKSSLSDDTRQAVMNYFIPIVAIATVSDCVPLIGENRAIVKRWLLQMTERRHLLPSLEGILDFLNIKWPLKSFHIWFIIGPRINAWWRLASWYDSLKTLLFTWPKQIEYLNSLDDINEKRKKLQAEALEIAEQQIEKEGNILIATESSFHEGIVGIVAGRLTEKYYKPSIILHLSKERNIAVGSLRWPDYFDVMEMMKRVQNETLWLSGDGESGILIKFGWHKQAGWLTVSLDNLETLKRLLHTYCKDNILEWTSEKVFNIDTVIHGHEWNHDTLHPLQYMEPFGQDNEEPIFLLEDTIITSVEKVWSKGKWHLKLWLNHQGQRIESLYWSKWDLVDQYSIGGQLQAIGKVKYDDYKRSHFLEGIIIKE